MGYTDTMDTTLLNGLLDMLAANNNQFVGRAIDLLVAMRDYGDKNSLYRPANNPRAWAYWLTRIEPLIWDAGYCIERRRTAKGRFIRIFKQI